eukprot:3657237-Rhodomonas_salina.1
MLSQVPRTQFLVSDFGECRLGHSRSFRFTWPHRVLELASPGLLLQSQPPYVCPYMSALICLPLWVLWHECPYVCPYASANCIHGDWNSRRSKRVWTAILILYLSMFHMVVEGSTRTKSSYLWSLEPPAWYLTLHVVSLFVSDEA